MVEREALDPFIEIDSAGTHAYHVGEPPDKRARETALRRGIDLSDLRARRVVPEDFFRFEYVLAMDEQNYQGLAEMCPRGAESRLGLFMDFAPHLKIREVPDPYYGGKSGFERVFDMVEVAAEGLLSDIRRKLL